MTHITKAAKRRAKAAKVKPFLSLKRVGGMTFVRVWILSFSFCISR